MGDEVMNSYVTIQGLRVHYEKRGSGTPLVLIHGLGGALMWSRVVPLLADRLCVLSVELPGFGKSDCPSHAFTTYDYMNIVREFILRQNIQRCVIVGISYGGEIATLLASSYPELVSKLVLICSTGLPPPRWMTTSKAVWKMYVQFLGTTILQSKTLVCLFSRLSYYDIRSRPVELCQQYMHTNSFISFQMQR